MYNVLIRPRAEKFLNKIPLSDFERISKVILGLADNPYPHGVEMLTDNIYRIRIGNYRVIYMVEEKNKTVDVGKVDRRRERTYKELKKLFK